jgi:hypothetical protein
LPIHCGKPCRLQRSKKRLGASVEYRRLGAVHLDRKIVDSMRRYCCKHVLDCVNRSGIRTELRLALACTHLIDERRNGPPALDISAQKSNALP